MKSENPCSHMPPGNNEGTFEESRLLDEKVSDESGIESSVDRVLAPAGLNNPFWN